MTRSRRSKSTPSSSEDAVERRDDGHDAQAFRNRSEAGRLLADELSEYARRDDVIVLGLPRGGVPVGHEIARARGAPLDVFVVRKLGIPVHEEAAFGAIATGGTRVINKDIVEELGGDDAPFLSGVVEEGPCPRTAI